MNETNYPEFMSLTNVTEDLLALSNIKLNVNLRGMTKREVKALAGRFAALKIMLDAVANTMA